RDLRRKASDDVEDEVQTSRTSSWEASFDPDAPSAGFTFANQKAYSRNDLQDDINTLLQFVPPLRGKLRWLVGALHRGIAVHHSGMNKNYRNLIERLFRTGFIRIMISTGTLALGINAPAKTTVFVGDSPFLTALMYRQCGGRAGRRGFDLLGNNVFYGIPYERVQRLVLSKLPTLEGAFPMTSTLTLRLFNLLHGSNNAEVATKAVASILDLPHISFTSDVGKNQLLHHIRFSIEYLRRSRLLDGSGTPMNLYAIAAHLYHTEPSNFALIALIQGGVLANICSRESRVVAKEQLMLILCHLFGRKYVSRAHASIERIQELSRRYPSRILLPPLPDIARRALQEHDCEILQTFITYASTYVAGRDNLLGPDTALPLSKHSYAGQDTPKAISLRRTLRLRAVPHTIRSSFVACSGHGDVFSSIEELSGTTRSGLHLNGHAIPLMNRFIAYGGSGLEHALNSYIYDFYMNGQVEPVESY
ncbi:hypothetical protein FISHEDRAFT_72024, partial [Fistulina hepatica ATCC 64428]